MTTIRQHQIGGGPNKRGSGGPFGWIGSLVMLVVGLVLTYLIITGIFTLLLWFSIPLFIAGVAIDHKGALSAGKSVINLSKKNPLIPIAIVILSALFFPTVPLIIAALSGGFLLTKALIKKKFNKVFEQHMPREEKEDFVEFEEVTEEEDFLELPNAKPQPQTHTKGDNEYDNLFE